MCLMIHLGEHRDHGTQHESAQPAGTASSDELIGILRRRYALGEITKDQFAEMQQVLGIVPQNGAPNQPQYTHDR